MVAYSMWGSGLELPHHAAGDLGHAAIQDLTPYLGGDAARQAAVDPW